MVDPETGRPVSVAGRVLGQAARLPMGAEDDGEPGGTLDAEFKQQQVETDTPPRSSLADLEHDLRRWRHHAVVAARRIGARVVASGTSPEPVKPEIVRDARYERIVERYGITATEQLTCGCHVHVSVDSDDEGVTALNRIRVWLPILLAISANSPFWQGQDSRYASFRSQVMARWPSSGPTETFSSGAHYRSTVDEMVASGVLLDEAMVYFDARLSARYPTVEVRVADACLDVRDAVLLAALCRALVDTAVDEAAAGVPMQEMPTTMLRLAMWQASKDGLDGDLLDVRTGRPRPARELIAALLEHVQPALEANGDSEAVRARVPQLLEAGNGARQQREVLEKTNRLADVVAHLGRVTAGQEA